MARACSATKLSESVRQWLWSAEKNLNSILSFEACGSALLTTVMVIPATRIQPQTAVGAPPFVYAMGSEPEAEQVTNVSPKYRNWRVHGSHHAAYMETKQTMLIGRMMILQNASAIEPSIGTCDAQKGANDGKADGGVRNKCEVPTQLLLVPQRLESLLSTIHVMTCT